MLTVSILDSGHATCRTQDYDMYILSVTYEYEATNHTTACQVEQVRMWDLRNVVLEVGTFCCLRERV